MLGCRSSEIRVNRPAASPTPTSHSAETRPTQTSARPSPLSPHVVQTPPPAPVSRTRCSTDTPPEMCAGCAVFTVHERWPIVTLPLERWLGTKCSRRATPTTPSSVYVSRGSYVRRPEPHCAVTCWSFSQAEFRTPFPPSPVRKRKACQRLLTDAASVQPRSAVRTRTHAFSLSQMSTWSRASDRP